MPSQHRSRPARALARLALSLLPLVALAGCKSEDPIVATTLTLTTAPSANAQNRVPFIAQPVVQLRTSSGANAPTAGIVVTAAITAGGGTLGGTTTATTDAAGAATFTNLSIAGSAGTRTIEFTAPNLASVSANVTTAAGAPTAIAINGGNNQTATVNTAVAVAPSVLVTDVDGNPVAGVTIAFAPLGGSGTLTGNAPTSNASGIATVGSWTIGTLAGDHTLTAGSSSILGVQVTFSATGTPGAAAKLAVVTAPTPLPQNRVVFPVQPVIRVQDAFSNNTSQAGVTVNAAITSGGGTLQGTTSSATDASGIASFSSLAIAGTIGTRTLSFTATGLTATTASVTTTAGSPVSIAVNGGNNQTAQVGTAINPSVKVSDQDGNGVTSIPVTWAVTGGGGSTASASTTTNSIGVATVAWTLGATPGANSLTATRAGLSGSPVTFNATGSMSAFDIELVFLTSVTPAQEAAFNAAVARWRSVIMGDIPDVNATITADECMDGVPAESRFIDDLVIYVRIEPDDGPGDRLGFAGPCRTRGGSFLPGTGVMSFDSEDVDDLLGDGSFDDVILHEMGHVLGIGTIWGATALNILVGAGTADPYFPGAMAVAQFDAVGGGAYSGNKVPVEGLPAGPGTADGHWRESEFDNELMTGFLNAGANPMSVVTIGSLDDLGYTVDLGAADAYTWSAFIVGGPRPKRHMKDDILRIPLRTVPLATPGARPPDRPRR